MTFRPLTNAGSEFPFHYGETDIAATSLKAPDPLSPPQTKITVLVIGESCCGKTSLIRSVGLLVSPTLTYFYPPSPTLAVSDLLIQIMIHRRYLSNTAEAHASQRLYDSTFPVSYCSNVRDVEVDSATHEKVEVVIWDTPGLDTIHVWKHDMMNIQDVHSILLCCSADDPDEAANMEDFVSSQLHYSPRVVCVICRTYH